MRKRVGVGIFILSAILFCIYRVYIYTNFKIDGKNKVHYKGKIISDVYTDKARYNPGEEAIVKLELNNLTKKDFNGSAYLYLKCLGKNEGLKEKKVNIKRGEKLNLEISIKLPNRDFKGYMVEVYLARGRNIYDIKNSAINVSTKWNKFPIYGYITDFSEQETDKTRKIIEDLNKYHINALQFYDWQDKHHNPLPKDEIAMWEDIAGREISLATLKDYISAAHEKNIKVANYNLIYGAYTDYEKDGVKKEWGLFKDKEQKIQDGHNLPYSWESSLKVFNPSNKEWQKYIFTEEERTNKLLNFDIWHMDTLGNRGYLFDNNGNYVDVRGTYKDFVNNALSNKTASEVVFNTVNTYGLEEIAKSNASILYSELWPSDYPSYFSLKQVIDKGNNLTNGEKKSVLAAYMNYEKANSRGEFNENSVRLCDAVIFAAGGGHIELGDTGMLGKEYFPNKNLVMTDSLKDAMRNYYDFLVAYENLLRDGLRETKNRIEIKGIEISNKGQPNKVWCYSKVKDGYDVIQLINFLELKTSIWRDDFGKMNAPGFRKNLKLKYYTDNLNLKNLYLASPDINGGKAMNLKYRVIKDVNEKYLEIEVPELRYWDMIYIER